MALCDNQVCNETGRTRDHGGTFNVNNVGAVDIVDVTILFHPHCHVVGLRQVIAVLGVGHIADAQMNQPN